MTDKELMIYRVTMELEDVVEQGWYEEKIKYETMETGHNTGDEDVRKKIKIGDMEAEGSKENISFGGVGLKQFEEMKKKNDEILNIQKEG